MSDSFRYPDFFHIGAYKAASTSLHYYFDQHPQIFMAREKGGNYLAFSDKSPTEPLEFGQKICTEDAYREQFLGSHGYPLIGESSPHYLCSEKACAKIHELRPDARLVAVLRNPVDAIYARYLMQRRNGSIRCELQDLLDAEEVVGEIGRMQDRLHLSTAFYGAHLSNYFRVFPREQIRVILYEDLIFDARKTLVELFTFLGVDPGFKPRNLRHYNRSGVATGPISKAILHHRRRFQPLAKRLLPRPVRGYLMDRLYDRMERPAMSRDDRQRLFTLYRDDINYLENLIERDLRHWLPDPGTGRA